MILLSERVRKEMHSEAASLWIIPSSDESYKTAAIMKVPSASIKAIITKCKFDVSIALHDDVLMYAYRVYDVPESPLVISGCITIEEELSSVTELLNKKTTQLFLFNELDICIGWSEVELNGPNLKLLEVFKSSRPYIGEFNSDCSYALDCLHFTLDTKAKSKNHPKADVYTFDVEAKGWNINTTVFMGVNDYSSMVLDDKDEGVMLERAIWSSLESVFPFTLHKSPQVRIGDKSRELTDVLAFDELGAILIESKDLSVIQAGFERSMDRRVAGVQKQVNKAIGQLVGVCNALSRGEEISDSGGEKLEVNRDAPHHCIVLVTEINHHGDWSNVVKELISAFRETRCFFHLLDLRELVCLLKLSCFCPKTFRVILVQRFKQFMQLESIHIRSERRR